MASSIVNTTTTLCASCGKEGGNLNTCHKCKMVKYCNAACKKKHRSRHKKQCERRVAELHDEALFKEHPPREECPISCGGKIICNGCIVAILEEAFGRGKIELCAFCREPYHSSNEENIKQIKKLADADNAYAFFKLAGYYALGDMGIPQDIAKSNELLLRAGELGCGEGHYNLGLSYYNGDGVEVDKKKAKHFFELAAINGDLDARHCLGWMEEQSGNYHRAIKHFIIAARAGFKPSVEFKPSLDYVKEGFMNGMITKDEYANTLRAFQSRQDEMKSDQRDKASRVMLGARALKARYNIG